MTGNHMPADWAIQRAKEEGGSEGYTLSFARYIEKHEQPPVDPDVLDVRQLAAAWVTNDDFIEGLLVGRYDDDDSFRRTLAAYKQIKGERG